ncbi:MAG: FAD-binding protein [Anaerolineales bacterium]
MDTSVQVFPTGMVENAVIELRSHIRGQVILPSNPQYDRTRQAWNLSVNQRPALIVIAQCAEDVSQAVRFARRQGLGIAVQSGGHGVVLPANDALLVVTNQLRQLRLDAEWKRPRKSAWRHCWAPHPMWVWSVIRWAAAWAGWLANTAWQPTPSSRSSW